MEVIKSSEEHIDGIGKEDCKEIKAGEVIKDGEETIDSDKVDCKDMKTCGEIGEYKKGVRTGQRS